MPERFREFDITMIDEMTVMKKALVLKVYTIKYEHSFWDIGLKRIVDRGFGRNGLIFDTSKGYNPVYEKYKVKVSCNLYSTRGCC